MRFEYPGTILIIDDDPVIIDVLKLALESDYQLKWTTNGLEGLAMAQSELPDLVLLDVKMPDITGHALCRLLKAEPETRSIPVIFITSMESVEDEVIGLEAGAVDYITKPVIPTLVRARISTHMELKRQRDYLQALSATDGLTGTANRRQFDAHLAQEWRRGARAQSPATLIMVDVDCFKRFNDTYGHLAGDECLKTVARVLAEVPHRGGDLVARFGGEEFAVILPDTPFEAARLLGERCRVAVESAQIPHATARNGDVVTISVGVATVVPDHKCLASSLVEAADRMMYQAKNQGGNGVRARNLCIDVETTVARAARA